MDVDEPTLTRSHNNSSDTDSTAASVTTATNNDRKLITFPKKRPLRQDDPFFQEGAYEYKAAWLRLEDANAYIPDMIETEDKVETQLHLTASQACHYDQCHGEVTFSSAAAYEHHYETNHRHICQNCRKTFPGEKWLDFHIHEHHDVMVKIRKQRGERTYECFVDGCKRPCSTPEKRRCHLIDKHHYPKWFNFNIVHTGVVPFADRMRQDQKEKALWKSRTERSKKDKQNTKQCLESVKPEQPHSSVHAKSDTLKTMDAVGESDAMDVEPVSKTVSTSSTAATAVKPEASAPKRTDRRGSFSTDFEVSSSRTWGLPPKKNAFKQYRGHNAANQARRRQSVVLIDQTMEEDTMVPTPSALPTTPATTTSTASSSTMDMDMELLQQSMSRLMVPRSVSSKMHGSTGNKILKVL